MLQRSAFIDLLKVLLTVGIVFRHSELVGLDGISPAFDTFTRAMMAATGICVPLFFVISGYLFFLNVPEKPGVQFFIDKWRRRILSLLVPYIIANALAFVAYWAAYRFAPGMMSGYFGDNWKNPLFIFWTGPENMSLWFIRDLIIAVLTAPLAWLLVRYTKICGVLALAIVCLHFGMRPWYNLWFIAGAWLAVSGIHVHDPQWLPRLAPAWQAWCFFVYLYHYIPVISLKKVFAALLHPAGFASLFASYMATALVTLTVVSALFLFMKKFTPRTAGVLVGGKL